jgi:hypothetical protein
MRFFVLALLLLLSPSLAAAKLKPVDFAYGMPISFASNGAIFRLVLPWDVYVTVARDDLGDIRIFNSAGVVVPHILRQPKIKSEIRELTKALPFFPLYQEEHKAGKDGLLVRIEKGRDGAIINVESGEAGTGKDRKLSGYIIDASKHEERIHELAVTWRPDEENFVTTVAVEYSNDLTHWSNLVPLATLARMRFSGHEIVSRRIPLPAKTAKYLRLTWPAGGEGVEVNEILALSHGGEPEQERVWTALKGELVPDESNNKITAYEYDSAARLPVGWVRLRFGDKNTLVKATLLSRPDRDAKWHFQQSVIFYDLRFDHATLVRDSVAVSLTPDRYWRLEMEGGASVAPANVPLIELGWVPHELLFVAQGEGPFLLAYGSARFGKEELSNSTPGLLAQVMGKDEDALLKEAVLLPKTILGGSDRLVPEPPPLPWRKWLLWGVLVVGVGVIAKIALSLGNGLDKEQ